MSKYAILTSDFVTNIIVADSLEEASKIGIAVEYTDENPAYVGGKYDSETGKFFPPVEVTEVTEEEAVVENA